MTRKSLLTGCASGAIVIGALAAVPALAAGTPAGTVITNNVTVDYSVGGINQNDVTTSNTVTVDRKVDLIVARIDVTATLVTPGAPAAAVTFEVTNLSNAPLDFDLSAAAVPMGSASGFSGTVDFLPGTLTFYRENDAVTGYSAGDALITHIDGLAADGISTVYVVAGPIPLSLANGDVAAVTLTATARENDGASTLGAALSESPSNTTGEDTVFVVPGAAFSQTDDYVVLTATLSATKTSTIIVGASPPFSTGLAIPGATVEYCVAVTNSGGTAATGITITDPLPDEVTFDAGFGVRVGGAACNTPGPDVGGESGGTVSGTIATLAAGATQTLIFRATID